MKQTYPVAFPWPRRPLGDPCRGCVDDRPSSFGLCWAGRSVHGWEACPWLCAAGAAGRLRSPRWPLRCSGRAGCPRSGSTTC